MRNFLFVLLWTVTPMLGHSETSADFIQNNADIFEGTDVPRTLAGSLANSRLILIGESHGTNEMPEYALSLVQKLAAQREIAIGFEFPIDSQVQIETFLKTGDETILSSLTFFKDEMVHSGRGSKAMIQFLRSLRNVPHIKVFCFDLPQFGNASGPIQDRDTEMAQNILTFAGHNPNLTIVTYSGNIHSRLTVGFPSDPSHKNMGSEILRLSNGVFTLQNSQNILFRYDEGSAWQCRFNQDQKITCGSETFGPRHSVYATAVQADRYFLHEPEITDGHSSSIFIRKVSSSAPWLAR